MSEPTIRVVTEQVALVVTDTSGTNPTVVVRDETQRLLISDTGLQGVPGESAYELAVRYGYSGTEADFAQSLEGTITFENRVQALETKLPTKLNIGASVTAGEALGGHRAVYVGADAKAYYADPSTADINQPFGITLSSAVLGGTLLVQGEGEIIEPSWTWVPGQIYLGPSGTLTQTPVSTGSLFLLGNSAGPTRMRVALQLVAKF